MTTSSSSSTAFAAGTLVLPYCASFSSDSGADWIPFKDCRLDFGKLARDPKLSYVIEQVDYLVRTEFIAVSVKSFCSTLLSGSSPSHSGSHIGQGGGDDDRGRTYMRIWILPAEDAGPEQAAWLRSSKRALLSARSEALRAVLGMVDCSIEAWEGRARPLPHSLSPTDTNTQRGFFSPRLIREEEEPATPKTLSGVFQSLASPRIDDARLDGDSREVVSDMLQAQAGGGEVEGLRSVLYGYQGAPIVHLIVELSINSLTMVDLSTRSSSSFSSQNAPRRTLPPKPERSDLSAHRVSYRPVPNLRDEPFDIGGPKRA